MKLSYALHISPDGAALLATLGILLIYIELNRPGLILPGATGLLIVLLSSAALTSFALNATGVVLITVAACLQVLGSRYRFYWVLGLATGVIFFVGCSTLLARTQAARIHLPEAAAVGLLLGPGTSVLTTIARRAHANKGLDS